MLKPILLSSIVKTIVVTIMISGITTNVSAQDHLIPDIPYIIGVNDYSIKLKDIFKKGFTENVLLRVLVLPSFSPEYMVGIRKTDISYEVFLIETCYIIWGYKEHNELNICKDFSNGDASNIRKSRKEITKQLSLRLVDVWKESLLNVKHMKKPPLILDGTHFHLSMFLQQYGNISGMLVSPDKNSKMKILSELIMTLVKYTKNETNDFELENYLDAFESYKIGQGVRYP